MAKLAVFSLILIVALVSVTAFPEPIAAPTKGKTKIIVITLPSYSYPMHYGGYGGGYGKKDDGYGGGYGGYGKKDDGYGGGYGGYGGGHGGYGGGYGGGHGGYGGGGYGY